MVAQPTKPQNKSFPEEGRSVFSRNAGTCHKNTTKNSQLWERNIMSYNRNCILRMFSEFFSLRIYRERRESVLTNVENVKMKFHFGLFYMSRGQMIFYVFIGFRIYHSGPAKY